jgi:hypothetical protein
MDDAGIPAGGDGNTPGGAPDPAAPVGAGSPAALPARRPRGRPRIHPRELPDAAPGPVRRRAAAPRARLAPAQPRTAGGKFGAKAPAKAAGDAAAGRDLAQAVFDNHARAARWLNVPELALSPAEARDVAAALAQMGELTGWRPSGPLFGWLSVLYVLGGVYGGRIAALAASRSAQAKPSSLPSPVPAARPVPMPPPLSASPAPPAPPPPAPAAPAVAAAMAAGPGEPFEAMPGPLSTLAERLAPL